MLGGVLVNLLSLISSLLGLYEMVVVAAALISWVSPDPHNPIVRFLHQITDPLLQPIRRLIRGLTRSTGMDFSPLLLILALAVVQSFVQQLIFAVR